jgi:dGTPase
MILSRELAESEELARLAPWAQLSSQSVGRAHPELPHPWRTHFQRDRARIIHSRAFRRLESKTQVFLNGSGDHLRTRLTHTMEVASITRAIATALRLNADLAETIALAHDLGHPPVGHAGEEMLASLMKDHGGFEHNSQSLRIVSLIESKFPDIPGLNLSWEVLEGLRKHDRSLHRPGSPSSPPESFPQPSLEAQIANLADEIAYSSHDIEDGLDHGLISVQQLDSLEIWQLASHKVLTQFPTISGELAVRYTVRTLIDWQVEQLVSHTASRIAAANPASPDDVRRLPDRLAASPPDVRRMAADLRRFLYANLYHHPTVASLNAKGCALIHTLFNHFLTHPDQLGPGAASRIPSQGLHRTVCDYLSGFTDRFLADSAASLTTSRPVGTTGE